MRWTPWQPLSPSLSLAPPVLAELLDGGQSFRWWRQPDGSWLGQWGESCAQLRSDPAGVVEWRTPHGCARATAAALPSYLGDPTALTTALDQLPWRSDPHLQRTLEAFPGLRLLRQPFGETLLGFLCSATKQIVQIKQMLALLARRVGERLPWATGELEQFAAPGIGWRLPTWDELAAVKEADLRQCLLGFRARYIAETARFLAEHPGWLAQTERLPYAEAKTRLCELPGVGEKVADCALLFGAGKVEAFPVDVWILKAMQRRYGLADWPLPQVAQFGRVHFGPHAGLAQQYLFAFERAEARTGRLETH